MSVIMTIINDTKRTAEYEHRGKGKFYVTKLRNTFDNVYMFSGYFFA